MHKAYLTRYNLASDLELDANPASLCRLRPAEDGYTGTMLEDHFSHFIELEIFHYMSWDEYIAKPRHELKMIRDLAERRMKMKNMANKHTVDDAEAAMKSLGLGGS